MSKRPEIKILLVEDERVTARAIELTLEKQGYECLSVGNLERALYAARHEHLDLIISDVKLPDGTGLELLQQVRDFQLDLPFVIITASERRDLLREAIKLGANDFLTKPFHMQNLPTVIERNLIRKKIDSSQLSQKKVSVLIKTIQALIAALDAKDSYTSGHSMRVARHARLIGDALHLTEDDLFTLELAALLHDIGKIGMPDHILNKTSSLEELEYNTAKEHPVVGSRIVGKIDELNEVAAIIRHHHERFDGSGYPDGLAGEAIPLFSRILTIADAYESIVSKRSYHQPRSQADAIRELRNNAGTQFDPVLCTTFTDIIKKNKADSGPALKIESGLSNSA